MRTETIQGVMGFVDMYHDEYNPKRFVSRCRKFDSMHKEPCLAVKILREVFKMIHNMQTAEPLVDIRDVHVDPSLPKDEPTLEECLKQISL